MNSQIETMLLPIFYGVLAGFGYGFIFYLKAVQSDTEPFDPKKFFRSLLIGGIVGGVTAWSDVPLTELNYEVQVATYGFITVLVDQIIKLLWRTRGSEEDEDER